MVYKSLGKRLFHRIIKQVYQNNNMATFEELVETYNPGKSVHAWLHVDDITKFVRKHPIFGEIGTANFKGNTDANYNIYPSLYDVKIEGFKATHTIGIHKKDLIQGDLTTPVKEMLRYCINNKVRAVFEYYEGVNKPHLKATHLIDN